MATASQIFDDRDTAGADYAAALAALKTDWINLRAHDIACSNSRVYGSHPQGAVKLPVYSFRNPSTWVGDALRHPVFVGEEFVRGWEEAARASAETLINGLS
jgi:hypothetical protein